MRSSVPTHKAKQGSLILGQDAWRLYCSQSNNPIAKSVGNNLEQITKMGTFPYMFCCIGIFKWKIVPSENFEPLLFTFSFLTNRW